MPRRPESEAYTPDVRALAGQLYVIEVLECHRPYHARWWRSDRSGYSNRIADVGLYSKSEAEEIARGDNRTVARPLLAVLAELGKPVITKEKRRTAKADEAAREAWRRNN